MLPSKRHAIRGEHCRLNKHTYPSVKQPTATFFAASSSSSRNRNGTRGDTSHTSRHCGELQFDTVFNETLAKASQEQQQYDYSSLTV